MRLLLLFLLACASCPAALAGVAPTPTVTRPTVAAPAERREMPAPKPHKGRRIAAAIASILLIAGGVVLLPVAWWVASFLFALGLLIGLPPLYRFVVDRLLKKAPKNQGLIPMGLYFWGLAFGFAGSGVAMCLFYAGWMLPLILLAFLISLVLFVLLWGAPHMYG